MDNNIRGAFEIGDALVSLDLAERFFCCDIDACLGACCIEGDAGAPITKEEFEKLHKKDTNKCEEYRKQINKQFGDNIDSEPCKVIKEYENNT